MIEHAIDPLPYAGEYSKYAECGDLEGVKREAAGASHSTKQGVLGQTPVLLAWFYGHLNVAKWLVD